MSLPRSGREALGVVGNISIDTSSPPEKPVYRMVGGAALYVAAAAVQTGVAASPISVIGEDLRWIVNHPQFSSLDWTFTDVQSGKSCAFGLRYNELGALENLEADYGVSRLLTDHALRKVQQFSNVHICCRAPLDAATLLAGIPSTTAFTIDFFVSSAEFMIKASLPYLPRAALIFLNRFEFEILRSSCDLIALPPIVVTNGPDPVEVIVEGSPVMSVTPPPVKAEEVTGAGDTLCGTTLGRLLQGSAMEHALREGVNAASRSVRQAQYQLPPQDQ